MAWEVLHPWGTHSRLPTTHNASKDTQSRGGLLQARQKPLTHGAQPLWGNTLPSVSQPEWYRQTTLTPVKSPSALQPGISLKGRPAQCFPNILSQCPVDEMGPTGPQPCHPQQPQGMWPLKGCMQGKFPHHPSLWRPRTGRSIWPEGRHNPMSAGKQGCIRIASQGTGGFRTGRRSRAPGTVAGTPLLSIPRTLPGSWEVAGTSRTKSPSSSRRGGHLREGMERARGYPPSCRLRGVPRPAAPGRTVAPQIPAAPGRPRSSEVPTVYRCPPASAAPLHRTLGEPQPRWLRGPRCTSAGAPGIPTAYRCLQAPPTPVSPRYRWPRGPPTVYRCPPATATSVLPRYRCQARAAPGSR